MSRRPYAWRIVNASLPSRGRRVARKGLAARTGRFFDETRPWDAPWHMRGATQKARNFPPRTHRWSWMRFQLRKESFWRIEFRPQPDTMQKDLLLSRPETTEEKAQVAAWSLRSILDCTSAFYDGIACSSRADAH
jgi:hypothetical protein